MSDIYIPSKFLPLAELVEGKHPTVTKVIVTGGRYSGKTHTINRILANAVASFGHRLAHTRYTAQSLGESIVLTFKKALDDWGVGSYFTINNKDINSTFDDSRVFFRGIKTGSGNQDSSLKGLEDVSIFASDEASEIPTFEEWEKVDLSIRGTGEYNVSFSIIILNPTSTLHWIYTKFFEERNVLSGFNGINGDTMYIHTSWKDLEEWMISDKHLPQLKADDKFYNENNIEDLTGKELRRYIRYRDVIMGGWRNSVDNVIFENWETFTEWRTDKPIYHTLGLDFGFKDPNAIVETKVYKDAIYVRQHLFKPDVSNQDLANKIKQIELEHNGGKNMYTIADNARPEIIKELQKLGCAVVKCKKGAGSIESGIQKINSMNLFVYEDSLDLINELNHYHYVEKINILGERKIVPVDEYNHLIDSLRYSVSLW
jgi:phage terminase large subunit